MYELRKVTKTYRKNGTRITALQEVDLSIAEGEFLAIQGPAMINAQPATSSTGRSRLLRHATNNKHVR